MWRLAILLCFLGAAQSEWKLDEDFRCPKPGCYDVKFSCLWFGKSCNKQQYPDCFFAEKRDCGNWRHYSPKDMEELNKAAQASCCSDPELKLVDPIFRNRYYCPRYPDKDCYHWELDDCNSAGASCVDGKHPDCYFRENKGCRIKSNLTEEQNQQLHNLSRSACCKSI